MSIGTLLDKGIRLMGLGGSEDTSKKEQDVISETEMEIQAEQGTRAMYEKSWYMNIAFLAGHHWVIWDTLTKNFSEPKAPDYRVRLTVNKILRRTRQVLADISSYEPRLVATPNSTETLDEDAAELATKVIRGLQVKLGWRKKKILKTMMQLCYGNAFIHYYWDASLGVPIPAQAGLTTGDVNVEVVSPYEIIPLGGATSLEECRKLAWRRYVSLDDIKARWPDKGAEVKEERDDTNAGLMSRKVEALVNTSGTYGEGTNRDKKKALLVKVWERPSPTRQNGRYTVYANNVLLEDGDNPLIELGKEFEIPFVHYHDIQILGRLLGQSTIEQMIPINKELNKGRSQVIEKRNIHAKPTLLIVKGTVDKNAWTSEPGKRVEWDASIPGAQKPDILPPPAIMSQGEYQLNILLENDLMDIGGRHEASLGKGAEGGASSGVALAGLRGADEKELEILFIEDTENSKIVFGALLKLVQKFYTEGRKLKTVGDDKGPQVISFNGADLRDNTDIWVESEDILPYTREGRQKFVLELFKTGLLGDITKDATRQRALKMLRWGNIDELWEDTSLDHKYARSENKQIVRGMPVTVNIYDNHQIHILEHTRVLKSGVLTDSMVKQTIEQHLLEHQNWLKGDIS
ncbi:MAG: hypothetical protein QME51_08715, partial [Planctomycetota bacterium]|nr:hypothetical protein [Planctomycetota bacterium]